MNKESQTILAKLKDRANRLKEDTYTVYLAYRHPRTPWYAKVLAAVVVAYAFSPIDLIPDFIPFLGYLDDLILVPLGIALVIKMIPADVMNACRAQARTEIRGEKPVNWIAAAVIILIWAGLIFLIARGALKLFK